MESVQQMLTSSDKGRSRAQGILCYMFRNTLLWKRINYHHWQRACGFYFDKPHNKSNQDRGNLNKALIQDDMTWASFKKGLDLLSPYKATLSVKLTFRDKREALYTIEIDPTEDESDVVFAKDPLGTEETDILVSIANKHGNKKRNTLARLFHEILKSEKIDLKAWQEYIDLYISNPYNGFKGTKKEITSTISSIQRQLFEPRLSWNNFRKGIAILVPLQEDYILDLQWVPNPKHTDDITTTHVTIRDPYVAAVGAKDAENND